MNKLTTDPPYWLFSLLSLLCYEIFRSDKNNRYLILSIILGIISYYIKPIGAAILIGLWIDIWISNKNINYLKSFLVFFFTTIVPITLWMVRNYYYTGRFSDYFTITLEYGIFRALIERLWQYIKEGYFLFVPWHKLSIPTVIAYNTIILLGMLSFILHTKKFIYLSFYFLAFMLCAFIWPSPVAGHITRLMICINYLHYIFLILGINLILSSISQKIYVAVTTAFIGFVLYINIHCFTKELSRNYLHNINIIKNNRKNYSMNPKYVEILKNISQQLKNKDNTYGTVVSDWPICPILFFLTDIKCTPIKLKLIEEKIKAKNSSIYIILLLEKKSTGKQYKIISQIINKYKVQHQERLYSSYDGDILVIKI